MSSMVLIRVWPYLPVRGSRARGRDSVCHLPALAALANDLVLGYSHISKEGPLKLAVPVISTSGRTSIPSFISKSKTKCPCAWVLQVHCAPSKIQSAMCAVLVQIFWPLMTHCHHLGLPRWRELRIAACAGFGVALTPDHIAIIVGQ